MDMPKFIMLIGVPGSGKTTYAKEYIEKNINTTHLSSDLIRKELWGDEATQGDNNEVFTLMQNRAIEALNNGQNVIYDATNVTRKDRAYIISLCPRFVKIEAHVIWAPIETCIERDAARERTVGKAVIDKMLKRFQPPFYDEGFNEIKIITPDEFDPINYYINILNKLRISHDNPHHTLDIWEHCREAFMFAKKMDGEIMAAAMFHDVGKPYVKAFKDGKGNTSEVAHYYSHDNVGAWMMYGVPEVTPYIAWLVGNHMGPFMNTKYYNKLPPFLKEPIDKLHRCDVNAH